jgi:hypothetical protein
MPKDLLMNKQRREKYRQEFKLQENRMLISYYPRRNSTVLVLSTMHHDDAIDEVNDD